MCLGEGREKVRFPTTQPASRAGPTPCGLARREWEGVGPWPPQAQVAHCASFLSGNSRRPGLGGAVSFHLSVDLTGSVGTGS